MALFLVYGKNNVHSDPAKEARGCYKLGDIVEVFDDSKHDGDLVANPIAPPFYLVRITGVTKAQADKYMEPYKDLDNPIALPGGQIVYPTLRRRLHNVEVASIPAGIRAQLLADRYVSVSWAQVKDYIRNRRTNATAPVAP